MTMPLSKSPLVLIRNHCIGGPSSQKRSFFSLIQKPRLITPTLQDGGDAASSSSSSLQAALDHTVSMVKQHDPAGYLPGKLLATNHLQVAYFAVRSFWIETGLRFGTTALVPPHTEPSDHLEWWQQGIDSIYHPQEQEQQSTTNHSNHPTFKLLSYLLEQQPLTRCHFDDILKGRFRDLDMKQYPDMAALEEHAEWSCGSLMQLLLESNGHFETTNAPVAHRVAKLLGKAHGLTNALRTSIPVMSTTGKLIIPQELCERYGVKSPRYLLSALGQGDEECKQALRNAVRDITHRALEHLQQARDLRDELLESSSTITTSKDHRPDHHHIMGVFLPGLASETFLQRLEAHNYDLTDRNLRNVNWSERAKCSLRMIQAAHTNQY